MMKRLRIMICDDEPIIRRQLAAYLAGYGDADEAGDGTEAIDLARRAIENMNTYDLICLDIRMPYVDGQQALDQIRKLEQQHHISDPSRILMISSLSDPGNVQQAFEKECEGFIIKPFKKRDVIKQLENLGLAGLS